MGAEAQYRHRARNVLQTRPLLIPSILSLHGVCTVSQHPSESQCIERIHTEWATYCEYFSLYENMHYDDDNVN